MPLRSLSQQIVSSERGRAECQDFDVPSTTFVWLAQTFVQESSPHAEDNRIEFSLAWLLYSCNSSQCRTRCSIALASVAFTVGTISDTEQSDTSGSIQGISARV